MESTKELKENIRNLKNIIRYHEDLMKEAKKAGDSKLYSLAKETVKEARELTAYFTDQLKDKQNERQEIRPRE